MNDVTSRFMRERHPYKAKAAGSSPAMPTRRKNVMRLEIECIGRCRKTWSILSRNSRMPMPGWMVGADGRPVSCKECGGRIEVVDIGGCMVTAEERRVSMKARLKRMAGRIVSHGRIAQLVEPPTFNRNVASSNLAASKPKKSDHLYVVSARNSRKTG